MRFCSSQWKNADDYYTECKFRSSERPLQNMRLNLAPEAEHQEDGKGTLLEMWLKNYQQTSFILKIGICGVFTLKHWQELCQRKNGVPKGICAAGWDLLVAEI